MLSFKEFYYTKLSESNIEENSGGWGAPMSIGISTKKYREPNDIEDEKKLTDHARKIGYMASVVHHSSSGSGGHSVFLFGEYKKHPSWKKLQTFIDKHKLHHVTLTNTMLGHKKVH